MPRYARSKTGHADDSLGMQRMNKRIDSFPLSFSIQKMSFLPKRLSLGQRLLSQVQGFRWNSTLASESNVTASTSSNTLDTTHYRITLRRSAIGMPSHTRKVLESMGLRKRLQSVYRPKRADIAGMVLAVKELVHVENVRRLPGIEDDITVNYAEDKDAIWVNEKNEVVSWGGKKAYKAPRGYTIVGNLVNENRHREILASRQK